jgi:hypothetical protein
VNTIVCNSLLLNQRMLLANVCVMMTRDNASTKKYM